MTAARKCAERLNLAAMKSGRPPAIVAGASVAGLSCIRSIGSRGVSTAALDWRPWEPGLRSRYALPVILPDPIRQPQDWTAFLLEAATALETPCILLPAADSPLRLINAQRDGLAQAYRFCLPAEPTLSVFADKRRQYRALERVGAAMPRTIMPETEPEAAAAARELGSPCVARPAFSDLWTLTRRSKLRLVRTSEQAQAAFADMQAAGAGVVMQELIPGPDDSVLAVHTYSSSEGRLLGAAVKRKVRQDPPGFGNGSYYVTVEYAEAIAEAERLLEALDYRGIAGTEFKIDARDGKLKLIEINPRTAASGHVIIAAGLDIPWLYYEDLAGAAPPPVRSVRSGVRGVNLSWDLRSMRRSRVRSPWAWLKWAASVARADTYTVLSWRDPAPARVLLRRLFSSRRNTAPASGA